MMILWLAYSLVIGGLIAVAARLVERAALVFARATRYVWVAAMLLMLGTSIGSLGFRAYEQHRANSAIATQSGVTATASVPVAWWQSLIPAEASTARAGFATALRQRIAALTERLSPFDRAVFVGWALLTTFVGALVLHATLEGRRLLHASEAREMKGMRILVTDALGPAAVGLGATAVLMPRWALELEDQGTQKGIHPAAVDALLNLELREVHAKDVSQQAQELDAPSLLVSLFQGGQVRRQTLGETLFRGVNHVVVSFFNSQPFSRSCSSCLHSRRLCPAPG